MADRLIRLLLSLFVSILVARYLGPEQFGFWNYLLSFTMFFITFVGLGIDSILTRELINHPEKELSIMSTSFAMKLVGGLVGFLLNILIFTIYKEQSPENILMMSLMASLLIFKSSEIADLFFKAKLEAKYSVIGRNSAFVIIAILKIYFVFNQFDLIYFVLTNSLEMLIGGIFVMSFYFKKGNKLSIKSIDKNLIHSLLKDGLPMALSSLMVMLYLRIDQVMLTDMKGNLENGIYSTGVRMIDIVYFIPVALADSFFPGIVFSKKHEGQKYEKNIIGFYSIMTYLSIGIGIVTFIIAKPMMSLFFGAAYEGSGEVLQVFGLSVYSFFLTVATGRYLIAENYKIIILVRSFLGLGLNIALNLLWIPEYGFMGAAYASFVSYFVPLIILVFFKSSRYQLKLLILAFNPKYLLNKLRSD
jgi:O-antigen/teichoic acid export membrane protein